MECLINDKGRECTCCGEFKQWDEYGNKKKGVRGKQAICNKCKNDLRYAEKHGCLKDNNIDPKHYDADKIMNKYINRAYREKSKFYKQLFKKERLIKRGRYDCMGRECNDCGKFKLWKEFGRNGKDDSLNRRRSYCKVCQKLKRKPITKEQRIHKYKQKIKRRERRILESIPESSSKHYGFVYAYWCQELKCFKIGKTKQNPVDYMKVKSLDYGLHFKLYCYISSPIRDYDAEWIVSRKVIDKRVKHKKPCGGIARELYRCRESEVLEAMSAVNPAVIFG